jgi:hypothetical protein
VPNDVDIESPLTLVINSIFSFQAKDPHDPLPHPASTVPDPASSPTAKDTDKLPKTTPAPSSIANAPDNCVSNDTPVGDITCSGSAVGVPKVDVSVTGEGGTETSAVADAVPNAIVDETPVRVTVTELCCPQKPCPQVPSFQASAMVMTSYIKIVLI